MNKFKFTHKLAKWLHFAEIIIDPTTFSTKN